jgi:NAD-dependent deacetylase
MKPKIVVLTGAGISAESGIQTFRGSDGLWEGYNIADVATPEAWAKDKHLVQEFYNKRRKAVLEAQPNAAHLGLVELEQKYDVRIITQNIDNLHERAGSSNVLHLHGQITKAQSTKNPELIYDIDGWELRMGDMCELGFQLRPFIVWFGEAVPKMDEAIRIAEDADVFVVIGTSLVVYPAAGLVQYTRPDIPMYIIDTERPSMRSSSRIQFIQQPATEGIQTLIHHLEKLNV